MFIPIFTPNEENLCYTHWWDVRAARFVWRSATTVIGRRSNPSSKHAPWTRRPYIPMSGRRTTICRKLGVPMPVSAIHPANANGRGIETLTILLVKPGYLDVDIVLLSDRIHRVARRVSFKPTTNLNSNYFSRDSINSMAMQAFDSAVYYSTILKIVFSVG